MKTVKQGLSKVVKIENVTPKGNIFFRAWAIKTASPNLSFATSLKKAWRIEQLRKRMQSGTVEFVYQKSDGTIRIANGTLKQDVTHFTPSNSPRLNKSYKQFNTMAYFDVEAKGFRSFKVASLLNVF